MADEADGVHVPEDEPNTGPSVHGRLVRAAADAFWSLPVIAIAMEGREARVVASNEQMLRMAGHMEVGLPLREAAPQLAGQQIYEMIERVYDTEETIIGNEWRINYGLDEDVPDRIAQFETHPWRWSDGTLRGTIGWALDVTDRVLAREKQERELAASEQRYRAARDVVAHLQEALLPADVPVLPRVEISARYLVAGHEQAAGGDWYDAIPLDDGRVALVLGDVVGHGVAASAAMGQLRAVLIDLLTSGAHLTEVAHRLHRFAHRVPGAYGATLCVVLLDQGTGEVDYVSLAHPPALLIALDGTSRWLEATGDGPLGTAAPDTEAPGTPLVSVQHDTLAEGEVLFLYSDGLVERPATTLPEANRALAQVAADAATRQIRPQVQLDRPTERVVQLTVELLTRTGYDDDVTVLAAQRRPEPVRPFSTELTGDYTELATARRALGQWLDDVGTDDTARTDLQVVVTEALTNAVEHAYAGGEPQPVTLHLELRPTGDLHGRVADGGAWQPEGAGSDHRGRGLSLVSQFTDDLHLDRGSGGTTLTFRKRLRRSAGVAHVPGAAPRPPAGEESFEIHLDGADPHLLSVAGPLDAATADRFDVALRQLSRGGARPVTVDLRQVSHLASAGVQVLHRFRELAERQGHRLHLVAVPGSPAQHVLDLVDLPYEPVDSAP